MAKEKTKSKVLKGRPATSPEEREEELVNLAIDLAEQQLRDGSASTQVIVHYLKLGSTRGMTEQKMLEKKTELLTAQTDSLKSAKRVEELYSEAMEAMARYSGSTSIGDKDEEL